MSQPKPPAWPNVPNEPSRGKVVIKDFAGYMPSDDPHDIPAGAAVSQVNAASFRPGELRVRKGAAIVRFED